MGRGRGRRASQAAADQDGLGRGRDARIRPGHAEPGEKAPYQCRVPNFCEIEWDGQWYAYGDKGDLECKSTALEPGKEIDDWVKASLDIPWVHKKDDKEERLQVAPGKHTMRVAFLFDGGGRLGRVPRPVSQPVEVEVGKESAWGDADGGVQARLRTPKAAWNAGEAPTFILDLRTVGKATAEALHAYANLRNRSGRGLVLGCQRGSSARQACILTPMQYRNTPTTG